MTFRTPAERYAAVADFCGTEALVRRHMSLERAAEVHRMRKQLHAEFVPVTPTKRKGIYKVFDFAASERGVERSIEIDRRCVAARHALAAADEAFLADVLRGRAAA